MLETVFPLIEESSPFQNDCIVNEGFLSDIFSRIFRISPKEKFDEVPKFRDQIVDSALLFSKSPEPLPLKYMILLAPAYVDNEAGAIVFRNINYETLFRQIKETYGEKRLDLIFHRLYRKSDIAKFKQKKIPRGRMKITSLVSPIFFALELSILFSQLYKKYNDKKYKEIVKILYNDTWLKKADERKPESVDVDYAQKLLEPKYVLKPYQIDFIKAYPVWKAQLNLRGIYNAFDQGLGKTLTALSLAMALKIEKVYVICPNTLVSNWYQETNDYYAGRVIPYICKSNIEPPKDAKVFITNNESIKAMLPYIDKNCKSMLIIDEGHSFRNFTGSRVKELIDFSRNLKPNDILPMSGTPLKATPNELVPMLELLDPLFTPTAAEIYNKCFNFDKYQAMEIVTARLGKVIYRKMKSDVLQLPEKTIRELPVKIKNPDPYLMENIRKEVLAEYSEIYPQVIDKNRAILEKFKDTVLQYSTAGARKTTWYLSTICKAADFRNSLKVEELHELDFDKVTEFLDTYVTSNPLFPQYLVKDIHTWEKQLIHFDKVAMGKAIGKVYPKRRTELYCAMYKENEDIFIKMINENEKKTVIFTQFLGVADYITKELNNSGIRAVSITGSVKGSDRSTTINDFKYNESIRVIVATSQSMGTGVTLVEASQMFFYGPPWRSADYDQCCDRIYRIGQDVPVNIYNVVLDTSKLNLSSKMEKILKWSSEMFHSAIDVTIVTEGFLFNENTIYLNIDKWKSGEINALYITGLSGTGKGYTAKQYANEQEDVITIELDKFENYPWYINEKEKDPNVARGDKIIFSYLKDQFGDLSVDVFQNDPIKYKQEMKKFMIYLQKYMKESKYMKFIIEGLQIFCDDAFDFLDNTYPIIVIRTSTFKSMLKVMSRKHATIRNRMHTQLDFNKKLKEFVKRLEVDTSKITTEAISVDDIKNKITGKDKKKLRFNTPEELLSWMKNNFKYTRHTKLKTISEMLLVPRGSCHDQTHFESYFIGQMNLPHGVYFMIESNFKRQGGETHSFLWFKRDNKYYWFENAWEDMQGIHEFNSLKDMLAYIRKMHQEGKWGNKTFYPKLEFAIMKCAEGDTLSQIVNKTFKQI